MKTKQILGLALAVCLAGSASAIPAARMSGEAAAPPLPLAIAQTASAAETAAGGKAAEAVRIDVRGAVQELIVEQARPPGEVQTALETVLRVCPGEPSAPPAGYDCPGSEPAYLALKDILDIVIALAGDLQPAAAAGTGGIPLAAPGALEAGATTADYSTLAGL